MSNKKVIFWDFDGVLINSNEIRDLGFRKALSQYPQNEIDELINFHQSNGGLSRYVKFKFFFENIRKEDLSDNVLKDLTSNFSLIMKDLLVDKNLLINETLQFIKNNFKKYNMHITSGSDQDELRYLCEKLNINQYFLTINGSPTPKTIILKQIIEHHNYLYEDCLIIGDAINDYNAALDNKIDFFAYNNKDLDKLSTLKFNFYG